MDLSLGCAIVHKSYARSRIRLGASYDAYAAVVHEDRLHASVTPGTPRRAKLRVSDVPDPVTPSELPPLSAEKRDPAYHLYGVGDRLLEVGNFSVTCWDPATSETTDRIDGVPPYGSIVTDENVYLARSGSGLILRKE